MTMTPDKMREHVANLMFEAARELADDQMGIAESLEGIVPAETTVERMDLDDMIEEMAALARTAVITIGWLGQPISRVNAPKPGSES